jgi:hypothetical protein
VRRARGSLHTLSLFGNEALGDVGAGEMLEAARCGGGAGLKTLDIGGCGVEQAGLVRMCEALMETEAKGETRRPGGEEEEGGAQPALLPALETLVVGGNPGVQGDGWEAALGRLREARPGLDVAWRAADAGDDQQSQQQGQQMLAQHQEELGQGLGEGGGEGP